MPRRTQQSVTLPKPANGLFSRARLQTCGRIAAASAILSCAVGAVPMMVAGGAAVLSALSFDKVWKIAGVALLGGFIAISGHKEMSQIEAENILAQADAQEACSDRILTYGEDEVRQSYPEDSLVVRYLTANKTMTANVTGLKDTPEGPAKHYIIQDEGRFVLQGLVPSASGTATNSIGSKGPLSSYELAIYLYKKVKAELAAKETARVLETSRRDHKAATKFSHNIP